MNKEMRQATERELEDWPGVTMTEEQGKNHTKLTLAYNGQSRLVVAASTPSDVRAIPNHLATMRREIRALGAKRKHVVVTAMPKPATAPVPAVALQIVKEQIIMSTKPKAEQILDLIGELRYSEMLQFAERLSYMAAQTNLRRGQPASWAKMLHAVSEIRG